MESTVERGAEEEGCRPAGKEGCCWWTCSGRLWCSDLIRVGNWDGPVGLESSGNWSKERNWSLRSDQEQESDTAWTARERDSAWGSRRGCR